jgi:hypothetical protein
VPTHRGPLQPAWYSDAVDQRHDWSRHRAPAKTADRSADGILGPERGGKIVTSQCDSAWPWPAGARSQLLRLESGGWVVDTPGIRQFQLWDILPEELEGFFPEFRPFVHLCGYPDCTHTHEDRCAIKAAVLHRQINDRRYTSYLGMFSGRMEEMKE